MTRLEHSGRKQSETGKREQGGAGLVGDQTAQRDEPMVELGEGKHDNSANAERRHSNGC